LLDRIKQQREQLAKNKTDATVNSRLLSNDSIASTASELDISNLDKDPKSSKNEMNVIINNCTDSSFTSDTNSLHDVQTEDQKTAKLATQTMPINEIMMSSHNVSSLHLIESDNNRLLLNAKSEINQSLIAEPCQSATVNTTNTINLDHILKTNYMRSKATCSIDLSHASRDPMIAGPKELFNTNDIKLVIELKQNELNKQQQQLEDKLKELERQEARLAEAVEKTNTQPGIDSGNESNDSFESNPMGHIDSSSMINRSKKLTEDDLKRIRFQQMLLSGEINNSSNSGTESEIGKKSTFEKRKAEVLQRLGVKIDLQSQTNLPQQTATSLDDKNAYSSADSGIVSMSLKSTIGKSAQQPAQSISFINMAVEQLNNEVINTINQKQTSVILSSDNDSNPVDLNIRRFSNASDLSTFSSSKSNKKMHHQFNRNFGLELYDSKNMSDLRDASIEKIIDRNAAAAIADINMPLRNLHDYKQTELNNLHSCTLSSSSSSCISTSNSSNECDTDTENSSFHSQKSSNRQIDEEEDDASLILSLFANRHLTNAAKQHKEIGKSDVSRLSSMLELKRQLIQEQLDAVQKQKEELLSQKTPSNEFQLHQLLSTPKPIKLDKEQNIHELSTIKEVDTPISERNIKLTSALVETVFNAKVKSTSTTNLNQTSNNDVLSPSGMVSSTGNASLASVSMLSVENQNNSIAFNRNNNNNNNKKHMDIDRSNNSSFSSSSNTCFQSEWSAPDRSFSNSNLLLGANTIRKKQTQLFNISLFETTQSNNQTNESKNRSEDSKQVDYAANIYDSLSTNSLITQSISTPSLLAKNITKEATLPNDTRIDQTKRIAFKSESTSTSSNKCLPKVVTNKKWFDILASTDDDDSVLLTQFQQDNRRMQAVNWQNTSQLYQQSSSTPATVHSKSSFNSALSTSSILSQIPLSSNELNQTDGTSILSQHPISDQTEAIEQSGQLAKSNLSHISSNKPYLSNQQNGASYESSSQSLLLDRTLASNTFKQNPTAVTNVNSAGLFDLFLKNYTSSSASVMEEPEISFVSIRSNSPCSNTKTQLISTNQENGITTDSGSVSSGFSGSASNSNSMSTLSLIEQQKRELSNQFANMSPIEMNLSQNQLKLNKCMQSLTMNTSSSSFMVFNESNDNAARSNLNEKNKIQLNLINELNESSLNATAVASKNSDICNSDSFKECLEKKELIQTDSLSSSLLMVETALTAPSELLTGTQRLLHSNLKLKKSFEIDEYEKIENETIANIEQFDTSQASITTATKSKTSRRLSDSIWKKSDSLISFEKHEQSLTNSFETNIAVSNVADTLRGKSEILNAREVVHTLMERRKSSPIHNSTPVVNSMLTSVTARSSLNTSSASTNSDCDITHSLTDYCSNKLTKVNGVFYTNYTKHILIMISSRLSSYFSILLNILKYFLNSNLDFLFFISHVL
jgi:hypothetical protein